MPEEKFTSGPWRTNENPYCIMDREGIPLVIVAGADRIELTANLRLIAEAPAMFELIKQEIDLDNNEERQCPCNLCEAGRAIVARVLGEG